MRWKRLTKRRFIVAYPLAVGLFALARITEWSLEAGIFLIVLGEAIRFWAVGFIGDKKVNASGVGRAPVGQLITAGPYAFVRHPLYLGTFFIGVGFCVIVDSLWLGLAVLICFVLVYRSKVMKEEELLRQEWPAEHELYYASVPAFLPATSPYPRRSGVWSWAGVRASKEWKTVIWLTVFVILLYFWEEAVQEHEPLFGEKTVYRFFLLGLLLGLVLLDISMELFKKKGDRRVQRARR